MTTKTSKDKSEQTPTEKQAANSGSKKNTKFVGGYLNYEVVDLIKEEARKDRRSISMEIEYLLLLGLAVRGYDVTEYTEVSEVNKDFQQLDEFQKWSEYRRG